MDYWYEGSAGYGLGDEDFTIEWFQKMGTIDSVASGAYQGVVGALNGPAYVGSYSNKWNLAWRCDIDEGVIVWELIMTSGTESPVVLTTVSNATLVDNWVHVAVYRIDDMLYVKVGSTFDSIEVPSTYLTKATTDVIRVGNMSNTISAFQLSGFTGKLTNVRVVLGEALYPPTSFATPSSMLTDVSGTALLLLTHDATPTLEVVSNILPISQSDDIVYSSDSAF
jgi:hypothetical protein